MDSSLFSVYEYLPACVYACHKYAPVPVDEHLPTCVAMHHRCARYLGGEETLDS